MRVERFIFGSFGTNTYVLSSLPCAGDTAEGHVLLVDPACSNPYEQKQLKDYIGSRSVTIIATHGHLDHLWGAAWACREWRTEVLMHEADIPMAEAMAAQYSLFGIDATPQPFPIRPLDLNAPLDEPAGCTLRLIHTPGHTRGGVCLYWEKEQVLLSGDTLFRMGYGRTDLPGGDTGQLINSLRHLFTLPSEVKVYPGHGESTTIAAERRY